MSKHPPTDEQVAILDVVRTSGTNLMANAYAGCGKSSTLELISHAMPPNDGGMALAFNVRIKEELEAKLRRNFIPKTFNGIGHSAWGKAIEKRCEVVEFKLGKIVREVAKEHEVELSQGDWEEIRDLAGAAMTAGLVPKPFPQRGLCEDTPETWIALAETKFIEPRELTLELARITLVRSIQMSFQGLISYDDQIYMSALFGGLFPRVPNLIVDEAQDLSPLNHKQIQRLAGGRIFATGDAKQAIYAFRGADSASMGNLRRLRSAWEDRPLATTFRCPHVVVRRQRGHAPGFSAFHSNPQGVFFDTPMMPSGSPPVMPDGWTWSDVERIAAAASSPRIAVLCRNNAPLIKMAFRLIREGVGCSVLGRDIGKNLITLSKKIFPEDATPADACQGLVLDWETTEITKAQATGKDEKVSPITDRAQCLLAVIGGSGALDAAGIRQALERLFTGKAGQRITLSTIHKAKGLEWPVVVHLDPWRVPSKFALREADGGNMAPLEQENNLLYVCETRVQEILINANSEEML